MDSPRRIAGPGEFRPLFRMEGEPVAVARGYGRGTVVVVGDAGFATNRRLAEEDNALFLAALASSAPGAALFDETDSRLQKTGLGVMEFARKAGLMPILIEAILLALVLLWYLSGRRIPGPERRPPERLSAADLIESRAVIYERANLGADAARAMGETVRELAGRAPSAAAQRVLARAARLGKSRLVKRADLLALSRDVHDILKERPWNPQPRPPR